LLATDFKLLLTGTLV